MNDELKKNARVPKKSSLILTLTKEELKVAPGFPSLNLDRALLVWHKSCFNVLDMSQCRVHSQPRGSFGSRNGLILLQSLGKHRKAWEEMERRILGTQQYWEPLADAEFSKLYFSSPAFQRENLVV